jgi:phosphotransferase system  glucose/maltose/N-acetylglucosamine-specific IIC component
MHGIQHFFHAHAEQVGGAISGGVFGVAAFSSLPNVNAWTLLFKVIGVVCFAAIGAATGFFVKRYLEKKYPK